MNTSEEPGFKLIVEDDEGRRKVIPVELGAVNIGRQDGNTVQLEERNVSRQHARIVRETGRVYAEDLDSYNGLWVNGGRVEGRRELCSGDTIRIGDFRLQLHGAGLRPAPVDEEETRRVPAPNCQATQPDIRLSELESDEAEPIEPPPLPSHRQPATEEPSDPPATARQPPAAKGTEPTAIIRVDEFPEHHTPPRRRGQSIAGRRARIVCVSAGLDEREFEISRTEMVIGRTDDNDIAIDHRSVSRHHAKIVTTGERHTLVDLQSANGTLVNGEEYARIELQGGDLIELGHVRFRFVPANESSTPRIEDEKHGEQDTNGWSAGGVVEDGDRSTSIERPLATGWVLTGAAVLALALIVVAVTLFSHERNASDRKKSGLDEIPPIAAPGRSSAFGHTQADHLVAEAHEAIAARSWKKARKLAEAALVLDSDDPEATRIAKQAERDAKGQQGIEETNEAISRGDWEGAAGALDQVPGDSVYAEQKESLRKHVNEARLTKHVAEAERAIEERRWEVAAGNADKIEAIDPESPELERLRTAATIAKRKAGAGQATRPRKPSRHAASKNKRKEIPIVEELNVRTEDRTEERTAESIYFEGKKALDQGQTQRAVELFNRCIQMDRSYAWCYRALGIAYARAGNPPKAARYYRLYIKVKPNASDADKVRELLHNYEIQQQAQ